MQKNMILIGLEESQEVCWIPVAERMPPPVTAVLVFGWCCDACWHIKIAEIEKGEWWESGTGEDLVFKPTHWMPLPLQPICS